MVSWNCARQTCLFEGEGVGRLSKSRKPKGIKQNGQFCGTFLRQGITDNGFGLWAGRGPIRDRES